MQKFHIVLYTAVIMSVIKRQYDIQNHKPVINSTTFIKNELQPQLS